MKITALSCFASAALLLPVSATPQRLVLLPASAIPPLLVETVVTEYLYPEGAEYPKGSKVLIRNRVRARSGEPKTVRVGQFEFVVTPTLRNNGTVDLSQTVTRVSGPRSPMRFGPVKSNVALGAPYGPSVGAVEFLTKVSLSR